MFKWMTTLMKRKALRHVQSSSQRRDSETLGERRNAHAIAPQAKPLVEPILNARATARTTLAEFGVTLAVEPLIEALDHVNRSVRADAAQALGDIGDVRAVEPLIRVLMDNNQDDAARCAAARSLGGLGDQRGVDPLVLATQRCNQRITTASAEGLAALGHSRGMNILITDLLCSDSMVSRDAAQALSRLGELQWQPIWAATQGSVDSGYYSELAATGDQRIIGKMGQLLSGHYGQAAFAALAQLSYPHLAETLTKVLAGENSDAISYAAKILAESHDSRAVTPLIDAFFSGKPFVSDAIVALGHKEALTIMKGDARCQHCDAKKLVWLFARLGDQQSLGTILERPQEYSHDEIQHALQSAAHTATTEQLLRLESIDDHYFYTSETVDVNPRSTGDHEYFEHRELHRISWEDIRSMARQERLRREQSRSPSDCI